MLSLQAVAPTRRAFTRLTRGVIELDGSALWPYDGAFVEGSQEDIQGYFSEFFHKYVRFVRSKACFGRSLGRIQASSMLTMLLSRGTSKSIVAG